MNEAQINIQRKRRIWDPSGSFTVKIDGTEVGKLRGNNAITMNVTAGRHLVELKQFPYHESLEVTLSPGQEARLRCESAPSIISAIKLWRADTELAPVSIVANSRPISSAYRVASLVETDSIEEPIGIEYRIIENPSHGSSITRTIRVTREWSKTCEVVQEKGRTIAGKVHAGFGFADVEGSVATELKRTYSITESSREEFTEELVLRVAPASTVKLALRWKRIWQNGVATVTGPTGTIDVPFRVVRAVTFDQSVTDV